VAKPAPYLIRGLLTVRLGLK